MVVNKLENGRVLVEQKEALRPGFKLLLASGSDIARLAIKGGICAGWKDPRIEAALIKEHHAIRKAYALAVGEGNIVETGRHILSLNPSYYAFPKNAHITIRDITYVNPDAWNVSDPRVIKTELGNAGVVHVRKDLVLASDCDTLDIDEDLGRLRLSGFRTAKIPFVFPDCQKYDFANDDIDCHSILIEDKTGQLELIVAESYYSQGIITDFKLQSVARNLRLRFTIIDDDYLPPLSFNLNQFDDLSVVMTSGASILEEHIVSLVGRDKVITTEIPIREIPLQGAAGVSCIANITPEFLM